MCTVDRPIHIIGRGDQESNLKRLARELGLSSRTTWTEWCSPSDLVQVAARASVAVLPSWHESFGNVMAEAMAVGTPLVTTNVGSVPEVVGPHAVLVAPGDVEGLSSAIHQTLNNEIETTRRSSNGKEWVRSCFHWDEVAARFEAVYSA